MNSKPSLQPWVTVFISLVSLGVSTFVAMNNSVQTTTAQHSLATANEQLAMAKSAYEAARKQIAIAELAQQTAEKNFKVAEQSLAFQRSLVDQDNGFAVVFNQGFLDAVDSPIKNQTQFHLAIVNKTRRTFSYRVKIESEGFTVFWPDQVPKQSEFSIYLDRNAAAVSAEAVYYGSFVVWHHQNPSRAARLIVKINENVALDRQYTYDENRKAYLPR